MKFQVTCLIAIIVDALQVVNSHSVQSLRGRGVPDFSFEQQALMASERQGPEVLATPSLQSSSLTKQPETHEHDVIFKKDGLEWSDIELRPGDCDGNNQYCLDVPEVEEGETVDTLNQKFRDLYPEFSPGWLDFITSDVEEHFDEYMSAKYFGIVNEGNSSTISTYALGIVIDNFYAFDYLNNKFKVDMKIYIREIEDSTNKTLEEVRNEAYMNETTVVEYGTKDGNYYELLPKPWEEINSHSRYQDAKEVRQTFCSHEYHQKMNVMSLDKFKTKFGTAGVLIQHSTAEPKPVVDKDGMLLYLKAYGAQISFHDTPNEEFFPLQSNILPIKLHLPFSRGMDGTVLCIDPHFTGIDPQLEDMHRINKDEPYLSLIPRITNERQPPFYGEYHYQMRNPYLDSDPELSQGNKLVEAASFTLLYIPEYHDGLSRVYPFIFLILATLLQWLVYTPDKFSNAQMVAAILQLQSVVNAQKLYLQYNNKLTQIIYLTYAIITANIVCIALMSYINKAKEKGCLPRLVRMKDSIFRMLRLLAMQLALFLIPILSVRTDPLTGHQTDLKWIWYIIAVVVVCISSFCAYQEYHKLRKMTIKKHEEEELLDQIKCSSYPRPDWTAEQVGHWIETNEELRDCSALTEKELAAIATKFVATGVKGVAFCEVAYDKESLKEDVGLLVGEVLLFVHTMEKLRSRKGSPCNNHASYAYSVNGEDSSGDYEAPVAVAIATQETDSDQIEGEAATARLPYHRDNS